MEKKELVKYELEEAERAAELAKKAKKKQGRLKQLDWDDLIMLSQVMYSDKITVSGTTHTYCLSAPLPLLAFLNPSTIVTILPYRSKAELENSIGMTTSDLEILIKEGIINTTIFYPTKYEGKEYLDPILKLKPPCYACRSGTFYSVISSGQFNELNDSARQMDFIKASPQFRSLQEPYQRVNPSLSDTDIIKSNAFRYASMCCILGVEHIGEIFNNRSISHPEKLKRLLDFHIHFDHPLTHGLGGIPFISSSEYTALSKVGLNIIHKTIQDILIEEIPINIPINPTLKDILQSHDKGIPNNLARLSQYLSDKGRIKKGNEHIDISQKVKEILDKLEYDMRKISLTAKKSSLGLTIGAVLAGVTGGLLTKETGISLAFIGLQPLLMKSLNNLIQKILRMRKSPALVYYWNLMKSEREH